MRYTVSTAKNGTFRGKWFARDQPLSEGYQNYVGATSRAHAIRQLFRLEVKFRQIDARPKGGPVVVVAAGKWISKQAKPVRRRAEWRAA